jgi:hypothetical protein
MRSSTSSSDPWRRFVRALAVTAVAGVVSAYAFPALARDPAFDSAVFGTSTSRLLRPAALDKLFGARFANLSMNAATAYEQSELMGVFIRAHPHPRAVLVGLDVEWCPTGDSLRRFTERAFPAWLYREDRWAAYGHMFDLYAAQKAVQAFAEFSGLKPRVYGLDGYTRFTPPDAEYDAARAAAHLREWGTFVPAGQRDGPPASWRFPALELLRERLEALPPETEKILFFVPYSRAVLPKAGEAQVQEVWDECKRRAAGLAAGLTNATAADFMFASPITSVDTNYWDGLHYREAVADRIARDLAGAARGEPARDGADRLLHVAATR